MGQGRNPRASQRALRQLRFASCMAKQNRAPSVKQAKRFFFLLTSRTLLESSALRPLSLRL